MVLVSAATLPTPGAVFARVFYTYDLSGISGGVLVILRVINVDYCSWLLKVPRFPCV